jgi:hypothetical protein
MKGSSKPPPVNDEKSPTDEDYFAEQKDFGGSESVALEPEAHVAVSSFLASTPQCLHLLHTHNPSVKLAIRVVCPGGWSWCIDIGCGAQEALVVDDPEFFEFCQALPSILSDHDDLLCMSLESWH